MNKLSADDTRLLDTLRQAGFEAVEHKRRLGQYAVVWRDGQPAFIGPTPPHTGGRYATVDPADRPFTGVHDHDDTDRRTADRGLQSRHRETGTRHPEPRHRVVP